MDIYATDFDVSKKGDESPVTQADQRAEDVILAGLAKIAPGIPWWPKRPWRRATSRM